MNLSLVIFIIALARLPVAPCIDGEVQLAGNERYANFGRLEVCANSSWGKVCGVNATHRDARVICKQLGFSPNGMLVLGTSPLNLKRKGV